MAKADLTAHRLRELLVFDQQTGEFRRRVDRGNRKAGESAGWAVQHGYTAIWIDGRRYLAHRLAWLYVYGRWPAGVIDHVNGNGSDNRVSNLRDADAVVNAQNRRAPQANGKSGLMGVTLRKSGRWLAQICVGGVRRNLGTHETAEEAHQAYLTAKRRLHQGCTI